MWQRWTAGSGRTEDEGGGLRLLLDAGPDTTYSDAQITDYDPARPRFVFRPPLRLSLRAGFSGPPGGLRGTAGFGFWNHPFVPGQRSFRLPQALWFFYCAPPSHMPLALDVPGQGWKAATFNARRWPFLALLPAAPVGFLLMRLQPFYRRLWPVGQWALGVSEALLDPVLLAGPHDYTLDWTAEGARFAVDGLTVLETERVPPGPLGFIAWVDNQYAVVTPQGRFGGGLVALAAQQSLLVEQVTITRG